MQKCINLFLVVLIATTATAQQGLGPLTVEKIMRDPKWMGTSPSNTFWSQDGNTLYFSWNPEKAHADSIYYITTTNKTPVKATVAEKQALTNQPNIIYNIARTYQLYAKDGDIFYKEVKTGKVKRITQTVDMETNPQFSFSETKIVYNRNQNLYAWDIASGETMQLTNVRTGDASSIPPTGGGFGRGAGGGALGGAGGAAFEDCLCGAELPGTCGGDGGGHPGGAGVVHEGLVGLERAV